jgi:hypothetical protein
MCPSGSRRRVAQACLSSGGRKGQGQRLGLVEEPTVTTLAKMPEIPRLALPRVEAAAALGMSLDSFERYVQAEVRLVRRGRMRLVPVSELRRWLSENAERPMSETLRAG